MTQLAAYDRARVALAEATRVDQVLSIRDEMQHVKLYARQIQDKALLEDAIVLQTRTERRLGILLAAAKEAGQIAEGRKRKDDTEGERVTLTEIGVDRKLSARAQKAAALDDEHFERLIEHTREKVRGGGAILVDPVSAATKEAEIADRRAQHAARTLNGGCIADLGALALTGKRFGSIGSDPQWKFLTRSAAGEGRSANIHYKTEEVDKIKDLPVNELLADDGAFYMWMVDWCPQDALDLLAHWGLKHVTTAFTWVKQNASGEGWHMGQGYWTRANPEQCWLATKGNPKRLYADVRQLIVAPVMEHSRKPDEWLDRIERLTEGDYLELQARRPRKGWTSWGDELEWTGAAA
ncbi:MT-A70 family methyltransferase [Bradyrhizobium sp. WSM1417]|uniref:MT-A70 family methyltransferase n=1 Tax=Bradyrhizobium sp. WSM1417 TaxID=754500 RepID=UPI0004B7A321|nr:MT-A70 family methyltransferase [Bradyrhizobium sp. WSM1417]